MTIRETAGAETFPRSELGPRRLPWRVLSDVRGRRNDSSAQPPPEPPEGKACFSTLAPGPVSPGAETTRRHQKEGKARTDVPRAHGRRGGAARRLGVQNPVPHEGRD